MKVYCYLYNYIKPPLPLPDKYLDASFTVMRWGTWKLRNAMRKVLDQPGETNHA